MTKPDQTGAALPPDNDEFDYTDKQLEAIHQALRKEGLKPEADWSRISSDIICLVSDVYGGYSHPDAVMYPGYIVQRLKLLETKIKGLRRDYNRLNKRLQWHLDDQCMVSGLEGNGDECWADSVRWAQTMSQSTGQHVCPTRMPARHNFLQLLDGISTVVRQAQERPPHEAICTLQYNGSPKNTAIRRIVEELIRICQQVTGKEPKLYTSSATDDGYKGNCYAFLVACVAPTRLVARRYLGSTLLAAYRDWKDAKDPVKASKQASEARPKKKK